MIHFSSGESFSAKLIAILIKETVSSIGENESLKQIAVAVTDAISALKEPIEKALGHRNEKLAVMKQKRIDLSLQSLLTEWKSHDNILASETVSLDKRAEVIIENLTKFIRLKEIKDVIAYPVVKTEIVRMLNGKYRTEMALNDAIWDVLVRYLP